MWTRKDLKQRAKEALKRNYWKIVLVTALAVILGGGSSTGSSAATSTGGSATVDNNQNEVIKAEVTDDMDISILGKSSETGSSNSGSGITEAVAGTSDAASQEMSDTQKNMLFGISMGVIFILVALFLMVFVYAFLVLLYNPFYTGVCRFMLKSVDDKAEVKEVAYGFDHSYKNVVKTMFHMDIRVFAWSLLFIIPGIYKKYQYRMVPYILAEHPNMDYKEALRLSSDIMDGEKWHTFVLDLSFIPWHVLGMITCGIVELFFVSPYVYLTHAALYRRLCELSDDDRQPVLS